MRIDRTKPVSTVSLLLGALLHGGLAYGTGKLLTFLLKLILARLGAPAFGVFYFSTETVRSTSLLSSFGLPMSISRFLGLNDAVPEKKRGMIRSAYTIVGVIGIISTVGIIVFAPVIASGLSYPGATGLLRLAALGIFGNTMLLLSKGIAFGRIDAKTAYMYEITDLTTKFCFTVTGLIVFSDKLFGGIAGYTLASVICGVTFGLHALNTSGTRVRFFWSRILMTYAWPVGLSEVVTALTNISVLMILSIRGGPQAVGIYGTGISVAALIFFVPQMVLPVFLPAITAKYSRKDPIAHDVRSATAFVGIPAVLTAAVFFAGTPFIYPVIFGPSYSVGVVPSLVLVSAHALYASAVWIPRQVLDMAGETKLNLSITALRSMIVITVGLLLIPQYGPTGAAIGMLFGWTAEAVAANIASHRIYG